MIENEAENEQAINLAESLSHRENRSLEETTLLNLLYEHRDGGILGFAENMSYPLAFLQD